MSAEGGIFRITDGDREAAVRALGEHYATGRLDRSEYDERSERAWAARTDRDVTPLFADLPAPHGNVVVRAPATHPAGRVRTVARWGPPRRRPFGPWLFLLIPLAFVLHAPWLLLVLFFVFVLRPARRWR